MEIVGARSSCGARLQYNSLGTRNNYIEREGQYLKFLQIRKIITTCRQKVAHGGTTGSCLISIQIKFVVTADTQLQERCSGSNRIPRNVTSSEVSLRGYIPRNVGMGVSGRVKTRRWSVHAIGLASFLEQMLELRFVLSWSIIIH